eukprot:scaffold46461_cov24-Tisochrysis_lutea.AAC.1
MQQHMRALTSAASCCTRESSCENILPTVDSSHFMPSCRRGSVGWPGWGLAVQALMWKSLAF